MPRMIDTHVLRKGELVIFRRADVGHRNWYCRVKLDNEPRYKTVCTETSDINEAQKRAFDEHAEVRFRIKHEIPVFDKPFSEVAELFIAFQKERYESGQITFHRWRCMKSHVKTQLNPYCGTTQITLLGQDRWDNYPIWRRKTGKGRSGGVVSTGTIRDEMNTYRSIMWFAAKKNFIRDSQVPKGKLPLDRARREEFTPTEYRKLHTFAREWIKKTTKPLAKWRRTMAYNYMLIMCNTGMRTMEARNLRWRDLSYHTDSHGRKLVRVNVRGKKKNRTLVAAENVVSYFQRVKALSKATESDDYVFSTEKGEQARTLYYAIIVELLKESKLLNSSSGVRRSPYCFRHTYATFRLMEGVDSIILAVQMGTSQQMIQYHYGHVNPVKHADRILMVLPGWEPLANSPPPQQSPPPAQPQQKQSSSPSRPRTPPTKFKARGALSKPK